MQNHPVIVWRLTDDKAGHRNQSLGLVNALAEYISIKAFDIDSPSRMSGMWSWFRGDFHEARELPNPDLIIGAGHATHLALLAAKRARGGKTVLLGKPTLPPACYDLCITPESDELAPRENVVATCGVLNIIRPSLQHDPKQGLILIGGPSGSHDWDSRAMFQQISQIMRAQSDVHWRLTTSRRTPPDCFAELQGMRFENLSVLPHDKTTLTWVPEQLAQSSQVWVSEDSVSMVYEALTSGAAVGLLTVPAKRDSRVTRGMSRLQNEKWVTRFVDWNPSTRLNRPPRQIDEAWRCARIVCERLLPSTKVLGHCAA